MGADIPKGAVVDLAVVKHFSGVLVPDGPPDQEFIARLRTGEVLTGQFKKPRNGAHHRKAFALLTIMWQRQDRFPTFTHMLMDVKVKLGHYDHYITESGEVVYLPRSISYREMGQEEFEPFLLETRRPRPARSDLPARPHRRRAGSRNQPAAELRIGVNMREEATRYAQDRAALANAPAQERTASPIEGALSRLKNEVGGLHEVIGMLEARLQPLMEPQPAQGNVKGDAPVAPAPFRVGERLYEANQNLDHARQRLNVILARLEV